MAENFVDELIRTIKPKPEKNRTHSAIVSKVDSDGVAWVYVAGSDRETPIASAASEIKRGDAVNVEWRNNKLYIAGNYSNPSAGVVRVTNVENAAQVANQLAGQASESAAVAQDAADRAVRDADTAHQAANTAQASADRSLVQLSIVEDVAGTLNWISEHGEYIATTDTTVDPNKVYFALVDGDYVPIANPDPEANPAESGWYVLDVTDSQSDYIMAHLAVTSAGLWVLPSGQWAMHPLTDSDGNYLINSDGDYVSDWSKDPQNASGYKVLLSATGMTVFDGEGVAVASYGAEMVLGRLDSGNLIARPNGIAVRDGLTELATFSADGAEFHKDGKTVKVTTGTGSYSGVPSVYATDRVMLQSAPESGNTTADSSVVAHPAKVMATSERFVDTEDPGYSGYNVECGLYVPWVGADHYVALKGQVYDNGGTSLYLSGNVDIDITGNITSDNVGAPQHLTSPTITKTAGNSTCSVIAFSGYGKTRMLILAFTTTAAISSGSNVFTGTITTTDARPKIAAGGSGFAGGTAVIGNINESGGITIRACGGSIGSGSTIWVYFTYFVA